MPEHPKPLPAAPLSDAEQQALVDQAFALERTIKLRMRRAHEVYWQLAEALWEFSEMRGWERLGYETLSSFLAQPDLGMSERSFYFAVRTWRDLVKVKQLPPAELVELEPSKVREVVPAVMAGQVDLKQAVSDCGPNGLSYRDIVERYRAKNVARHGQQPDGSTRLDASAEPIRVRCPTCGSWTTEDQLPPGARNGDGV